MQPTSHNQLNALREGTLPAVEEVRPGIFAIALSMPGMQPPYAFVYAILEADSREVHLIDAGLDTDENWAELGRALESLGRRIDDIASVTATHMHRDHLGLASQIRRTSGAIVRLHDWETAALERHATLGIEEDPHAVLTRWSVPESSRQELLETAARLAGTDDPEATDVVIDERLQDGDRIELGAYVARVIHTPGHTSGHVCLAIESEQLVFTGDHVLPGINPGIALGGERVADPLGEYFASLDRLAEFAGAEALPGHGYRFTGLGERCAEIRAHHEKRTRAVASGLAADPHATIWDIASKITWSAGWENLAGVSLFSALAQVEMHVARVRSAEQ